MVDFFKLICDVLPDTVILTNITELALALLPTRILMVMVITIIETQKMTMRLTLTRLKPLMRMKRLFSENAVKMTSKKVMLPLTRLNLLLTNLEMFGSLRLLAEDHMAILILILSAISTANPEWFPLQVTG